MKKCALPSAEKPKKNQKARRAPRSVERPRRFDSSIRPSIHPTDVVEASVACDGPSALITRFTARKQRTADGTSIAPSLARCFTRSPAGDMDVAVVSRQVQDAWASWDAAVSGVTFKALKVRAPSSSIAPRRICLFSRPLLPIRRRR
jgi:hypothetical protein